MQELIVGAIVLFATGALVRRYAPSTWKTACTDMALRATKRLGWNSLARRIEANRSADPSCASGCATCSGCGPSGQTPAGEFVVMFENLKRKNPNPNRIQESAHRDRN